MLIATGVVAFLWVRLFHPGAPRLCVGFIRGTFGRAAGRRVHSGSFGSLGRAKGVVKFIRFRLVHSSVPRGSSGSFGFFYIIKTRPGVRRIHSVSLIRTRPGVVGFILFRFVHRPGGRRVHSGSFASFGQAPGVVEVHSSAPSSFFCFVSFIRARPAGRRVNSACSFCSFLRALVRSSGFIRFYLVHSGSRAPVHWGSFASCSGGDRTHSCSFCSFWCATWVVGFVHVLFVHSGILRGVVGSIPVR